MSKLSIRAQSMRCATIFVPFASLMGPALAHADPTADCNIVGFDVTRLECGVDASAPNENGTAVGYAATASGTGGTTAVGANSSADGDTSTAVGVSARADGSKATAIGNGAKANSEASIAIGRGASAAGTGSRDASGAGGRSAGERQAGSALPGAGDH